jgi:hypothetical protein
MNREIAAALAGSAAASAAVPTPDDGLHSAAGLAWRWVVSTDALDLYADPLGGTGGQWRETLIGAGGALHRARVALAAEGLAARVSLLPDGDPDHLARLVTVGSIEITPEAVALFDATEDAFGLIDRARAPSRGLIRDLTAAAKAEGVRLRVEADAGDLIAVLHGPDTREAWLRAGAALSAVRLMSGRYGLAALPSLAEDEPRPGRRRVGEREGWLGVGIGTPYVRLHITSRDVNYDE